MPQPDFSRGLSWEAPDQEVKPEDVTPMMINILQLQWAWDAYFHDPKQAPRKEDAAT